MQSFVFSNDTAATEIYTLSLHDALPICKRVVFGKPGAPRASVADAVQASCSIPWVFRPVRIGDREYVDGGAWSLTNLDLTAAGRGDRVLCLHPSLGVDMPFGGAFGLVRSFAAAGTSLEVATVRDRKS